MGVSSRLPLRASSTRTAQPAAPAGRGPRAGAIGVAAPAGGRVTASPFAKKLADDLGVDLAMVTGTA